jgi:hypothetical protein
LSSNVQFDDICGSGALVQAIDVLGDDRHDAATLALQIGNQLVPKVRLTRGHLFPSDIMKIQDLFGIPIKRTLTGVVLVIVLRPDAALAAIGGNAALCGHTSASEKDNPRKIAKPQVGQGG